MTRPLLRPSSQEAGVTLIEFVVMLAVLAIVIGGIYEFVVNGAVSAAKTNDFIHAHGQIRAAPANSIHESRRTVTLPSRRPVTLSWVNLPVRSRRRVTLTWANLPIRAKVLVVVAIPLCALLAAAVAYYVNYRADIQAEQWVGHAQDVRTDIQEALIFLLDAETGMRGYLLTGQDVFLRRYENAAQTLPKDLTGLERLVQGQPTQIEIGRAHV